MTVFRYFRAFATALRLTLRGETPPPSPYADLEAWMNRSLVLTAAVRHAGTARQVNWSSVSVRVDGRKSNAETILAAIQHHMQEEYPYLLRNTTRNHVAAIYASNLNDQYRLEVLASAPELQDEAIQQTITTLKTHLAAIPPQSR